LASHGDRLAERSGERDRGGFRMKYPLTALRNASVITVTRSVYCSVGRFAPPAG
jgi:hypothetical protein